MVSEPVLDDPCGRSCSGVALPFIRAMLDNKYAPPHDECTSFFVGLCAKYKGGLVGKNEKNVVKKNFPPPPPLYRNAQKKCRKPGFPGPGFVVPNTAAWSPLQSLA